MPRVVVKEITFDQIFKLMNKYFPFVIVAVFATLISCTENEEPVSPFIGTWENRVFVDSLDVWFIEKFVIKNDSLVDIEETIRETETGPDLGYRLFMETKYTLEDNLFSYDYSYGFTIRRVPNIDHLFVPKNELGPANFDFVLYQSGKLTFSSDYREMDFLPICPSFRTGCPASKKYVKVD